MSSSARGVLQKLLGLVEAAASLRQGQRSGLPAQAGHIELDWVRRRAPPKPRDKVLHSDTHLWIRSIPWPMQPKHLCRNHPHLANRLARCWGHPRLVLEFMDDVLIDRRGHRQGVSDKVRFELARLHEFHVDEIRPGATRRKEAPPRSVANGVRAGKQPRN